MISKKVIMPSSNRKKKLLVFLSHANEDKPTIRNLCQHLKDDGFDPWLDEERILPGQDWQLEIEHAMRSSDIILVNFSQKSLIKEGYFQREYKRALDYQEEKPEGTIFVIPVRLDNCEIPFSVKDKQYVDYPLGYERLLESLKSRADKSASVQNSQTQGREHTKQIQIALKNNIENEFSIGSKRRYFDALDLARFSEQTTYENARLLKVLYAKAQLFLALAFGDTIVVSENQFFDSQGFLETFDELYHAAQKFGSDIDLPIRVAIREREGKKGDMFYAIQENLNNENFVLSLWGKLNDDVVRRKLWASSIGDKQKPADDIVFDEEKALLTKLWTALEYFTPDRYIIAKTIAPEFIRRIKQVLALSDIDIYALYTGRQRRRVRRKYFDEDEVAAAKEIRDALKKIQEKVGVIDTRSKIRRELTSFDEELKDGVIVLTDAIYNQTIGIGTRATLIQSSTFHPKTHHYTRAGYLLSTYIQDTSNNSQDYTDSQGYKDWEIYSLDYFEDLEGFNDPRRKNEFVALLDAAQKNTPWEKLLEMQRKPIWQASLTRFREILARLQSVEEDLSGEQNRRSSLEKERDQLKSQLKKYWTQHAKNINKLVANSFWSLTETEIIFSNPGLSIRLTYSFLKTKLDMGQDKDYKIWRNSPSFKGRLDESIDSVE